MQERYIRNIGALTEEECLALRSKTVFVAGCGGLGGHVIDMLLRLGIGTIRCADGDTFDVTNLNRQLLSGEDVIGKNKALTAKEHALRINSSVNFEYYDTFIDAGNASLMINGCDAVIDALDSGEARKILKAACDARSIPYIYGAVGDWTSMAAVSLPGDGLIDMIYPDGSASYSKSTLAFTPALCASMQCALCVKLLCNRNVTPGKLYYFDLNDFDFEILS